MRIPTTAEFFSFFATIGQLSSLSRMPDADSESSLAVCNENRYYTIKPGDTSCNSIGEQNRAPTYQIICQNDAINGNCTNLCYDDTGIEVRGVCLGRDREDCWETYVVTWLDSAQSIANRFGIPMRVFEYNNYCYDSDSGLICPPFNVGSVVCIHKFIARKHRGEKCDKIFAGAS